MITCTNDIRATTPRRPTQKPLTKLLGRRGLAPTLLLLTLSIFRTNRPSASPTATSPTAATTATPPATSTAATRAPTPSTSPTAATTSTAAPTTTPSATSTTTAATSTTLATLALAAAALRTSRSSPDVLSNRDVCSSSRGVGGGKGGWGAPLKEGRARSATSSTYRNCTSLSCKEMLLEEVNSEGGGVKREKVVPDRAKRVKEATPPSDESIEPSGLYPELVGCLMYLMTCTRPDLAYPLSILARYVAPGRHRPEHWEAANSVLRDLCSTSGMGLVLGGRGPVILTGHAEASWVDDLAAQRSSQGYTFSLGSDSVSPWSTRSSSILSSSCEAGIYAGAMAAQVLYWLTYLLTDLGERHRSPRVLYVENKAMIALC
ncbi:unnamed protein product [Closterium sp. NIES-54]